MRDVCVDILLALVVTFDAISDELAAVGANKGVVTRATVLLRNARIAANNSAFGTSGSFPAAATRADFETPFREVLCLQLRVDVDSLAILCLELARILLPVIVIRQG